MRGLDGARVCGERVRVEMSSGQRRDRGGFGGSRGKCYNCGVRNEP